MQILVKGNSVIEVAHSIIWGTFDEPIEKWALLNENGDVFLYVIDDGYTVIENVELPSDYVDGKYFYKNGGFVLNEDWKEYVSLDEKVENLETENSITQNTLAVQGDDILGTQLALAEQYETNMVIEAELVSTQLALAEQYEVNIVLEEELTSTKNELDSAQNEIIELQLAICDLYELMG